MCRNLCTIIAKSVARRLVGAILVRMVLLKAWSPFLHRPLKTGSLHPARLWSKQIGFPLFVPGCPCSSPAGILMVREPVDWVEPLLRPLPLPFGLTGLVWLDGSSKPSRGRFELLDELDAGKGCSKCMTSGWSIACLNTKSTGRPAAVNWIPARVSSASLTKSLRSALITCCIVMLEYPSGWVVILLSKSLSTHLSCSK